MLGMRVRTLDRSFILTQILFTAEDHCDLQTFTILEQARVKLH